MNSRFWTFNTLVGAFLDLFIAYFLLCGSTVGLFAVKFLGLFGLSLANNGFVGFISSDDRRLLVDYPTDKVSGVPFLVTRKFPFDSVFAGGYCCTLEEDMVEESEGDGSCSSESDGKKVVGNGIGLDLKGKHSSVSSSTNWVTCVDQQSNDGGQEASSIPSDVNYNFNEADKDRMIALLTRELEESQAARAALNDELEKERSAAASAADEAMSMILRLQEEKASVKMESRQYQRMIEEKSAFDAEEMNILKEIVLRREREKHFLEKQVEACRQMIRDQIDGGNNLDFVQDPGLMLHQLSSSRLYEDVDSLKQESEETIAIVGEENGLEINPGDAPCGDHESSSRLDDVHVIDNEPESSDKSNDSEMHVGLPPVSSKSSLRRYSTSALDNERTRLDTEVEWLRERLRIVQQGRVKLNFSADNREKEGLQMQLLEDIACQLQAIQMLTEPRTARQASLPLPFSKEGLTKIRR